MIYKYLKKCYSQYFKIIDKLNNIDNFFRLTVNNQKECRVQITRILKMSFKIRVISKY